jgi:predicted metal-binding membrane protein
MATLGLAVAAWLVALRQMAGMDMGVGTELGSFASFVGLWVVMMAAMMLPGAVPAVLRRARATGHVGVALAFAFAFVGSYLAIWTLVGLPVYALYRPHGTLVAGLVTIAAGIYELTPAKRRFRQCCRKRDRSGFWFGLDCVGSSIGLMLVLVAISPMSLPWMTAIAVVVVAQKFLAAKAAIDVPVGLVIIGLGTLIVLAPSSVPGLLPPLM